MKCFLDNILDISQKKLQTPHIKIAKQQQRQTKHIII